MSGEVSYFSRFFVKFVEIIAAGLASAISAYLLAHFVSSPTPASPPTVTAVQVAPNAVAAQPAPPAAAAAASEHPAPQDSPEAKLVPKTGRDAKVLPPRKHTKTDTSVAGKEPRNQKSAEEQVRAALANVDANRRVPADPAIGPDFTDTRSVPADDVPPRQASVPSQQPGVPPRSVDVPPRRAEPFGRMRLGRALCQQHASALKPVHGGGAEVREAVLRPQSAVPGEAIAVVGLGGDQRIAPSLVGDASQPRQQQEAQIVEVGDRLGPNHGFYSRDVRCSTRPKRFGRFPVERLGDGHG
jgi:hypothetical protein